MPIEVVRTLGACEARGYERIGVAYSEGSVGSGGYTPRSELCTFMSTFLTSRSIVVHKAIRSCEQLFANAGDHIERCNANVCGGSRWAICVARQPSCAACSVKTRVGHCTGFAVAAVSSS